MAYVPPQANNGCQVPQQRVRCDSGQLWRTWLTISMLQMVHPCLFDTRWAHSTSQRYPGARANQHSSHLANRAFSVQESHRFPGHLTTHCEVRHNSLTPKISRLLPGSDMEQIVQLSTHPQRQNLWRGFAEVLMLPSAFWLCWCFSGDAGDMPHHVVRVLAYVLGAWVIVMGAVSRTLS
jgi:hypothetical protein